MSKIKYRISLDMHSSVSQASLAAKEGDDNRQFSITLRSGGQPYKLERGAFAVFSTTLPDGKTVIEDNCIIVGDEITYDFTRNLTSQVGVLDIEIRLYGPDSRLITSPTFILVVSPRAAKAEDITSSSSYTALDTLYGETKALKDEVEKKLANGDFKGEKGDKGDKGDSGGADYSLVSNAIKKTATGNVVGLTDVSPFEHTLGVKAWSKNRFNINKVVDEKQGGASIEISGNDIIFTYGTTNTNHFVCSCEVDVTPNTDYVLSIGKTTSVTRYYVYTDYLFGKALKTNVDINTGVFNSGNNRKLIIGFYSIQQQRVGTSEVISEIMLAEGTVATPYTPFVDIGNNNSNIVYEMDDYVYKSNGDPYIEDDLYGTVLSVNSLMINSINNFAAQLELNGISIGEEYTELKVNSKQIEQGDKVIYISVGDEEIWGYTFNTPIEDDYVILRIKKSTAKIIDCGKNHFDKDNANIIHVSFYGKGSKIYEQGNYTIYIPCLPKQVYTVSKKGDPFTFLRMGSTAEVPAVGVTLIDFKTGGTNLSSLFMLTSAEARYLVVNITNYDETLSDEELAALLGDIQIELRQGATEYEPFQRFISHPINADGTVEGVTSLYPTTMLISDTEGIVLDVNYNADTKKYIDNKFAELAALVVNS